MTFGERLAQYEEARGLLVTVIEHLTSIRDSLSQYNESLSAAPSRETLANMGYRSVLSRIPAPKCSCQKETGAAADPATRIVWQVSDPVKYR